ncbi:MAG: CBS domain-containing protein [Candidatus Woesearchaeota archaeon]|nr:CBS domain-containing protein [Candidatus Woesearchaeota archaeon]
MKVKDIMNNIIKVPHTYTVAEIAAIMDRNMTGSVLLEDKGEIVGIITERDIIKKIVAKKKNPAYIKGIEIASYPLITIDANADIEEASRKMEEHRIRRLLVTSGGEIIGKVTSNAIAKNIRYLTASRLIEQMQY